MLSTDETRQQELQLARCAARHEVDAWHALVDRYVRLIHSVVRRYLAGESDEDRRTIVVQVLEQLWRGKLAVYDGRSALSTWITLITRRYCLDHLRRVYGRHRHPAWLPGLTELDRRVYQLHYLEGLDLGRVLERLQLENVEHTEARVVAALWRLQERLDDSTQLRLAFDLQARSLGAISGRLLQYAEELRAEAALAAASQQPDQGMIEAERHAQLVALQAHLRALGSPEGQAVERFFLRGETARTIAQEMGLDGQRRAYSLISRGLSELRRRLGESAPRERAHDGLDAAPG